MSSGNDVQQVDYSGVQSGFKNLANSFNKYMGEAYDWAKGQWTKQEPYSDEVQKIMLDQANAGADWAQADRQRWEQTYKPVEDAYVDQVVNYDTPGRRESEAARYAAEASNAAEAAADEAKRQLTTFGAKPTDVKYGALDTGMRMTKGANAVAASESARRNVENTGLSLKQGVIQQGNQYPARTVADSGVAQNAGTAGANVGIATDTAYGGLMGTAPQWGGLNVNALSGWNQSLTDQQKSNIAVNEANQSGSGGIGKLAGTIIGGAAGAYFGGPMGASVGANIGGQAGGMTGFAEGGVVDVSENGNFVPPGMSPSGGAATDDINAVIPGVNGGPAQPAQIDAGEFIFPRRTTNYYGTKHLQGLIEKADKAMAGAQQGAPPGGSPAAGPPQGYDGGGPVTIERGASTQLDPATGQPVPGWRDALRGAAASAGGVLGGAGGGAAQRKSALDIYSRWGHAEGGVVDAAPFDPEGAGYDDASANRMGVRPDATGHRQTYGDGGVMLKGMHHPTHHLSVVEDERLGYETYKAPDGRYYVRPKGGYGYADGGTVGGPVGALLGSARKAADWAFGERPPDPMRSWDMDPLPAEYPTDEDAREQRLYNIRHGDPRNNITNETRMSLEEIPPGQLARDVNNRRVYEQPSQPEPIGWDRADRMMRGKVAADQSAVGALGFDPDVTSYTSRGNLSWAGEHDPATGRVWYDAAYPSSVVHESVHRGHGVVERDPEGSALMDSLSNYGHEMATRSEMQRRFGDIEARESSGAAGRKQYNDAAERLRDPAWRKKLRDIDRVAHRINAQRVIDKAGGVYSEGGVVSARQRAYRS